jgi:H+/Cl- antiporter ClcA
MSLFILLAKQKDLIKKVVKLLPNDISYWVAAFLTGLAAVGYASLVRHAENLSRNFFIDHPYALLALSPLCFVVGWWVVYRFSPEARGSGIPQVMAAIESIDTSKAEHPYLERLLGLKTAGIKVLSSFFCVLGGGAVGREGPTIQIAASIFHFVNRKSEKYFHHKNYHFGLIAGGAAGIAAAFNTPLGGLVYGIEELATSHFNKFKTSLISGVIIAGLVSQWILGTYLYLGYPQVSRITFLITLYATVVGAITGVFGAIFGRILFIFGGKIRGLKKTSHFLAVAVFCGLALAAFSIFVDERGMGPGREIVIQLLFKDGGSADWKLALSRFISPIISYLSGCAGGIFAPSLAAGGALGAVLGYLLDSSAQNIFILVGMIGFLTGVTRAPFTSFVLVLEMTDRHTAIMPMMLAALAASMISKLIDPHSFYEQVKSTYMAQLQLSTGQT